jgi:orotidine-5'-phosphate decarboxylase
MTNPLIVALDVPTVEEAGALAKRVGDAAGAFKIGLELWNAAGPDTVRALDGPLFLDLKLHDIPTTVGRAIAALKPLSPFMVNVHALGGVAMMRAAVDNKPGRTLLLGVTILTSLSDDDLARIGLPPAAESVPHLASLAREAGCDGVVCAPPDIAAVRAVCPKPFVILTPGIRGAGDDMADQSRTLSAKQALEQGADYIVVGRHITRAPDPRAAALALMEIG